MQTIEDLPDKTMRIPAWLHDKLYHSKESNESYAHYIERIAYGTKDNIKIE